MLSLGEGTAVPASPAPEGLAESYRLLEIGADASPEEVRQAYLLLVNVWHPDRFSHNADLQAKAQEKLKAINEAYHRIGDASRAGASSGGGEKGAAAGAPAAPTAQELVAKGVRLTRNPIRLKPGEEVTWASVADLAEYIEGMRALREAIRLDQGLAEAWYHLGLAHSHLSERSEAVRALREAVRLAPQHSLAWVNLGAAHADRGEHEKVVEAFRQAVRLRPSDPSAWYSLGAAHSRLGQLDEAIAAFRQVVRLNPDLAEAWFALGMLRLFPDVDAPVDPEEALSAFERATRLKPDMAEAWYRLGATLSGLGRHAQAIAALREAVRIEPDYTEAWSHLGFSAFSASTPDGGRILREAHAQLERLDKAEAGRLRSFLPYHLRVSLVGEQLATKTFSAFRRTPAG
jgi:tetratricopeptide (TPR) repeat protein